VIARNPNASLILSSMAIRASLGLLGLALPLVLFFYSSFIVSGHIQPSISNYYHTNMSDYFVGSQWVIGVFLIAYRGYSPTTFQRNSSRLVDKFSDRGVSTIAGVSAIGLALFPVNPISPQEGAMTGFTFHSNAIHYAAAAIFFASMAIFCLVLFPRGDGTQHNVVKTNNRDVTRIKWTKRNRFFVFCGGVILLSMAALGLFLILLSTGHTEWIDRLNQWHYFFWWEVAALLAFAAAWLEKGRNRLSPQTILRRINR